MLLSSMSALLGLVSCMSIVALQETAEVRCVHGGTQIPMVVATPSTCVSTTCSYNVTMTVVPTGNPAVMADLVVPGPSVAYDSLTISGTLTANQLCTVNAYAANLTTPLLTSNYYANLYNYQILRANASIFGTFGNELILTATDGVIGDAYGNAVAMSGDGSIVVVGARNYHQPAIEGVIYIYQRELNSWVLIQEIINPTGGDDDAFGSAVVISYDASTIVVSSVNDVTSDGIVYVYSYDSLSGQYLLTQTIDSGTTQFGGALGVSSTGQYIIVGATGAGLAATVYVRNDTCTQRGSLWSLQQLIPTSTLASVAISADASTIAVGLPNQLANQGTVEMFTRSGTVWSLVQTLTASDGVAADMFGSSLALSNNGQYLLVGAPAGNQAYIFVLRGPLWYQENIFVDPVPDASFGESVAISADGTVGIIGAGAATTGRVFVAVRSPDNLWTVPSMFTGHSASAALGASCACSADGAFMVAGAPDAAGATAGSSSIFRPVSALIPADTIITGSLCVNVNMIVDADLRVTSSIFVNGSIITGGVTACTTPSDERLKTDIKPLSSEEAFYKLQQLKPVTFAWVNPDEHPGESNPTAGLIAQDVARYFPHWIYHRKVKGQDAHLVGGDGLVQSIAITPELYAYLVACIQGLERADTENDALIEFCKKKCKA